MRDSGGDEVGGEVVGAGKGVVTGDVGDELLGIFKQTFTFCPPCVSDAEEDIAEAGHPVAGGWWEVGSAVDGVSVWGEEHGHRPATLPRHCLDGRHVNMIQIRPFFSVNFDVDVVLIHQLGGLIVFEGFVRHDVTPVTGGVADTEEDRFVLFFGESKSFFSPWIPVYGIVSVLEEVGACFGCESVHSVWWLVVSEK